MDKEYKYDAFISYRHSELDKFVAVNLHKALETYNLPKDVRKKLNIKNKTFKRVFRDQEELPLTSNLEDPIVEALKESKYLIVICSPRLNESLWCKKEIETFKKLRGRKNIFCVLIEGEPKDSFPDEVLHDENGNLIEPLAADVRGKNKKEVLKKLKDEKLRLIAPMYNLDFDDLRQRHKIWKQKKIINTVVGISIACILFTIYTIAMFIKINLQQNVLSEYQALSLAKSSENSLKKDSVYEAIKYSYQALTNFDDIEMPYTQEAEYALSESLGLYDIGASYKAIKELKTDGITSYIKSSDDKKLALIYDESEKITLFDTKTLNIIDVHNTNSYISEESFSFIGNNMYSFINEKGNISIYDINGKLIKEIEKVNLSYFGLKGDSKGEILSYVDNKNLYIYNIKEDKEIISLNSKDKYFKELYYSIDENYLFAFTSEDNFNMNRESYMKIHVISIKDKKEINSLELNASYVEGLVIKGNNSYILLNKTLGVNYSLVLLSYDFINGKTNWLKFYDNSWGSFITKSYPNNTNNIAVVSYDKVNVINCNNGEIIESFNTNDKIINIYSALDSEIYLVFLKNGSVNYINMEYKNSVEYKGRFEFNLNNYSKVSQSINGFLLIPDNDNRVILYERKYNENMKKEDIKLDIIDDNSIPISKYDEVKELYNLNNKSLVNKIFYDTNEEVMFVNYTNNDISIYDVKTKKLIKTLVNVGKVNHYFGKDKYNRTYIGDISDSYILDKSYNKVGHIKSLVKLDNDKVIIAYNNEYYSLKIYTLKDMLELAKKYLYEN